MENRRALSTRRDMFLDERGAGLRVTWHPERDLVVLSVWQDDSCVGTFRMTVQDVPRLTGLLAAVLDDWVDQADDEARPVRRRAEAGPVGRHDDTDPGANLTATRGVDPATSPGAKPATSPGAKPPPAQAPSRPPAQAPSRPPAQAPGRVATRAPVRAPTCRCSGG